MKKKFVFLAVLCVSSICCSAEPKSNWFNDPKVQSELDLQTNSKAHTGNKVTLLINGAASTAKRMENLSNANIILIKTYEFWNDESGQAFIQQLEKKAREGAKIFIQFDVKGTRHTSNEILEIYREEISPIPDYLQALQDISKNNVFIIPTNVPQSLPDYLKSTIGGFIPNDHEKYFITWDSKSRQPVKLIMGGMNIGDEYLMGMTKDKLGHFKTVRKWDHVFPFRDTDVEVIGPVVQDVVENYIKRFEEHVSNESRYFKKNLPQQTKEALDGLYRISREMSNNEQSAFPKDAGKAFVRLLVNAPIQNKKIHTIQKGYEILLNSIPAGKTIRVATPFFYPTLQLQSSILSAANRGVKFKLLVNSRDSPDEEIADFAKIASCYYSNLLNHSPKNSIEFYEWRGSALMGVSAIHQKVIAFGEEPNDPFVVGSCNLDYQSLEINSEGSLLIQDADLKAQFDAMLDNDFNQPRTTLLSPQDISKEHSWLLNFRGCRMRMYRRFI